MRISEKPLRLSCHQLHGEDVVPRPAISVPLYCIADNCPPAWPVSKLVDPQHHGYFVWRTELDAPSLPHPLVVKEVSKTG